MSRGNHIYDYSCQRHYQRINCCSYHPLGNGVIKSVRVEEAMKAVDRKNYCRYEYAPYQDSPQSIG